HTYPDWATNFRVTVRFSLMIFSFPPIVARRWGAILVGYDGPNKTIWNDRRIVFVAGVNAPIGDGTLGVPHSDAKFLKLGVRVSVLSPDDSLSFGLAHNFCATCSAMQHGSSPCPS